MVIESGDNLTGLGYTWLSFHYLLPILIGILIISAVLIGGYIFYRWLINNGYLDDPPEALKYLFGIMALGFVIILLILT